MGHGIEKAPDVRVEHPVHLLPENADMESVQRIVLTAVWPESVGEPEEVLLVDGFENRRDRLLDDFVLQARDAACIMHLVQFVLGDRMVMREELATQSRSLRSVASVIVMTYGRPGFLFCAVMRPLSIQ